MAKVVRQSKFRHVYGKPKKREECYDDVKVTANSHDSVFCSINPKFLAVVTESGGGGMFIVVPMAKVFVLLLYRTCTTGDWLQFLQESSLDLIM